MDDGEEDWRKAVKYNGYLNGNNTYSIKRDAGDKMVQACIKGAHKGHPKCQHNLYQWCLNGFYYTDKKGRIKHTYVEKNVSDGQGWLDIYNKNPRNPLNNPTPNQAVQGQTQPHHSSIDHDIKIANKVIKTTDHALDFYNSLNQGGFF